jgi:hypothetical protein
MGPDAAMIAPAVKVDLIRADHPPSRLISHAV